MRNTRVLMVLLASIAGAGANADPASSARDVAAAIDEYRAAHEKQILSDFIDLLEIPNVATNLTDMDENAAHIVGLLEPRGFRTRILKAGNVPYVYAELNTPGAAETVLLYAHFDGQPVQEENWAYPPFSPTLLDAPLRRGGQVVDPEAVEGPYGPEWRLYARSAGDDKMPVVALMHTLDAMKANGIPLSVNLKLMLDGEEERGSPTISSILDNNEGLFESDLLLFCDGPMHQSRRTQLVYGVRGSMTVDITTYGATRPLHSGHYGNWAPNPIMQLSYLLTSMRDENGYILIDGYYDDVTPLGELERAAIAEMPDITELLRDELSVHTPEGDGKRIEELVALPALNARGIVAGGVGTKGRNIVLSTATTSLNLRLVPAQTPGGVRHRIESHMKAQGFHIVYEDPDAETLRAHEKVAKLEWRGGYPALRTPMDDPIAVRLSKLLGEIAPDLIQTPNMGGSLPLFEFGERLSAPIIILPLANHDNNQHAENENIRIRNIWNAMRVYATVLARFGET